MTSRSFVMNWLKSSLYLALSAALVDLPVTSADLGAAVWRSKHRQTSVSSPSDVPINRAVVLPLKKVHARSLNHSADTEAHFYVGSISVGQPAQEFEVVFDTSSGHILLPHRGCESKACLEHRRYSPWGSRTSSDIETTGQLVMDGGKRFVNGEVKRDALTVEMTQADFGDGFATGVVVRDRVCLGAHGSDQVCTDAGIIATTKLDDIPFRAMPQDGIVGLGLEGLSTSAFCSFFERFASINSGLLPHFGVLLRELDGEIHFGSHDMANICGPLRWFPVLQPEQGLWQIAIHAVRVGNGTVGDCEDGCRAIIDTSSSRLGVLRKALPQLQSALNSRLGQCADGQSCCQGPDLEFDLGDGSVKLEAKDYAAGPSCSPRLGPVDLDDPTPVVYAFGEVVLRSYYVAFDWASKRIGLARTVCDAVDRAADKAADTATKTMFV